MPEEDVPVGYCPHCRSLFIQHGEEPRCTWCGRPMAVKYSYANVDRMHEGLSRLRGRAFMRSALISLPLTVLTILLVYLVCDSLLPNIPPTVPVMIVCTPATAMIFTHFWRLGLVARFHADLLPQVPDPKARRDKFTRFIPAVFYTVLTVLVFYCVYRSPSGPAGLLSSPTAAPTERITIVTAAPASTGPRESDKYRRKTPTATPVPETTRLDPQQVLEWYKKLGLD